MKSWIMDQASEYLWYMKYYIASIFSNVMIKSVASRGVIIFCFLFGDINILVKSTAVIYFLDFWLWIYTAIKEDNFSVNRFGAGMTKLILYAILVILFNQADLVISTMLNNPSLWLHIISARSWSLTYISMHELISCLNKLKHLGVPVPEKLYQIIKRNKEKIW